ncbi:hypothetical protein JR316_0011669 [Psilocybe cubensis]|uniref:Uncharacterized protein n=2 Tax=Psilocybe cubensis TaxID=181762 RepID=A0A8H8CJ38_PSICU|nr:hypothetical protein JR316_0011669 [Psilocybe cubensis]KAH9476099.1 hypothetical protein JR316_0011669 [Psilocybe cubensis]
MITPEGLCFNNVPMATPITPPSAVSRTVRPLPRRLRSPEDATAPSPAPVHDDSSESMATPGLIHATPSTHKESIHTSFSVCSGIYHVETPTAHCSPHVIHRGSSDTDNGEDEDTETSEEEDDGDSDESTGEDDETEDDSDSSNTDSQHGRSQWYTYDWELDKPTDCDNTETSQSAQMDTAQAMLSLDPLFKEHEKILPPHVTGRTHSKESDSRIDANQIGVKGQVVIPIRVQNLSGGNGVTQLDMVRIIIATRHKESKKLEISLPEKKIWVLKHYDPHQQGSGREFAQAKYQGMVQINTERRAYARIGSLPPRAEGTEFVMWMGASLRLTIDTNEERLGILMASISFYIQVIVD